MTAWPPFDGEDNGRFEPARTEPDPAVQHAERLLTDPRIRAQHAQPAFDRRRLLIGVLATATALVSGACTEDEPPRRPERHSGPPRTKFRDGAVVTVTGVVGHVYRPTAFTLNDVDLPEAGLLVLTAVPQQLRVRDLATATGTATRFAAVPFTDLALQNRLTEAGHADAMVLRADNVVSYR